jgi:hypothetical protein
LITILFHCESGESIESKTAIPQNVQLKGMNDFQVLGSAITYLRRYALSSICGLVTDKDTDASGEQVKHEPKKPTIDAKRLDKALESIEQGKYSMASLLTDFALTPEQLKHIAK